MEGKKDEIGYLELQITDSCNLKCKGCSHCAGLMPAGSHIPFAQYERDVKRMKELVPHVRKLRLLGGEPFLVPWLSLCIRTAAKSYPDADRRVVTNGLLCLRADEGVYEAMRETGTGLDISLYPPTQEQKEALERKFMEEGIAYEFTPPVTRFAKRISLKGTSPAEETFWDCDSKWCNFLRDGVLSPCPAPVILDFLAERYGLTVDTSAGKLDLYRPDLTGEEVVAYLNRPNPVCRYCTKLEFFDWEGYAAPKLEDWIVEGET